MDGRISNLAQIAYVRRYTVNGGREDGLKVIEINNGVIRLLLNESKALDLMQLWHKGDNISFISKNGFTKREIPFLNRFEGGMIYTCGLDSVGGREGYELHGSFHNTPALVTECSCDENGIKVVAEMPVTSLFGSNLVMKRTITTDILGESVNLSDKLINKGTAPADYALLYHINVGYPMLDEGVKIISDAISVTPRNEWSKLNLNDRTVRKAPVVGQEETCYFIQNKTPIISVINDKLGKKFEVNYSDDTLPYFVQWNSGASQDYALGTEVSTTLLDDGFTYKTVDIGKSVNFNIKITVKEL